MTKISKFIFWAPRVLTIIFALFLAIFSFDVFDSTSTSGEILIGLFIHNIPSLILLIILILSWKRDIVGGITFTVLGALCVIGALVALLTSPLGMINPMLFIGSVVFLLMGALFLIGWKQKRKGRR